MKTISTSDAKARLNALVAEAASGQSITITHRGRPAAVLSPAPAAPSRKLGTFAGVVTRTADFDAPMTDEELAAWEGREGQV